MPDSDFFPLAPIIRRFWADTIKRIMADVNNTVSLLPRRHDVGLFPTNATLVSPAAAAS